MRKIVFFLSFLLIISCDESSDSQIGKKIKEVCTTQNCEINMTDIVPEQWDYMYIFKTGASLEFINSKLGFQYPYFEDIGNRMIFVKGNNVIYHEDEFPNPERIKKGEVIFDLGDSIYTKVKRENAIFSVHSEGEYFKLHLVKNFD
ncbi:hypothetical protein [Flavobacterium sp.]|uniref:hypothetical protein n=1 Tax=Flavobacterium sp. TaxID=239 RepID=UPI003D6A6E06